jgi:hypothetical protein
MTQLTDMTDAADSSDQQKTLPRGSWAMTAAALVRADSGRSR